LKEEGQKLFENKTFKHVEIKLCTYEKKKRKREMTNTITIEYGYQKQEKKAKD